MSSGDDSLTIFEACQKIAKEIPGDFGGGSPVPKTLVMAYLVQEQQLKKFVEVGVYRGRSLFPVAYSIFLNDGNSVGVDPYTLSDAKENDVDRELGTKIDSFLENLNFDDIYKDVLVYKEGCGYGESMKIIRTTAEAFFSNLDEEQEFDIAHIDGNHDTKFVRQDFTNCRDNLIDGGFIVFDDIDWQSVRVVYNEAKKTCPVVFECEQFGILIKEAASIKRDLKVEKLAKKLNEVYGRTEQAVLLPENYIPTVSVGVLTYNQAEYVEECLDSVFTQVGNFNMHVVICDDCSTDGTSEKISEYLSKVSDTKRVRVTYIRNEPNIGMVRNFQKLISLLGDSDYFTFCEGDDYYLSSTRIAQHIKLQQKNPQYSMSYNRLLIYKQDSSEYEIFEPGYIKATLPTEELVKENVIGNLGGVFYSTRLLSYLKPDIFDMFTGDWMLAIYLSQFGTAGLLNKPLNVYRRHSGGIWSEKDSRSKLITLVKEISKYNKYLNFTYDEYFFKYRTRLLAGATEKKPEKTRSLSIIDDISPHPISGFRYEEFTSILRTIPNTRLYTTGESAHVLGVDTINDLIVDYKRRNPELANSVEVLIPETSLNTTLLYCDFLGNAFWNVIGRAEAEKVGFIFTLYPGGLFALDNESSDSMLSRVMKSPCFRKVIVTQKITRDYLINNHFCSPDKIEYIWGVVVPSEKLNLNIDKKFYGVHKKTLDICFVAHKYSEHGQDKGYDVFIAVAKKLSAKYNHVRFHVVGPWDENVIDTSGIKNLKFYGTRGQDWFDRFYKDKDIILSPNINSKIFEGSFDGFPTGAATDAALRKVAMFVTDPLDLNDNHFIDNKEIVIIKHNVHSIVNKLEYYIENPDKLQSICEGGYKKTNILYSYEKQMKPRIRLLKRAINEPFETTATEEECGKLTAKRRIFLVVRWLTPALVKKLRRKLQRLWLKLRTI